MNILVFKTNILREDDVKRITPPMNNEQRIKRWTIDRTDCDNVLRIESDAVLPDEIIELVEEAGYACEELTY